MLGRKCGNICKLASIAIVMWSLRVVCAAYVLLSRRAAGEALCWPGTLELAVQEQGEGGAVVQEQEKKEAKYDERSRHRSP